MQIAKLTLLFCAAKNQIKHNLNNEAPIDCIFGDRSEHVERWLHVTTFSRQRVHKLVQDRLHVLQTKHKQKTPPDFQSVHSNANCLGFDVSYSTTKSASCLTTFSGCLRTLPRLVSLLLKLWKTRTVTSLKIIMKRCVRIIHAFL